MTGASPFAASAGLTEQPPSAQPRQQSEAISVLTYNVKGLPWPVARGRDAAFTAIEHRLLGLRAAGLQPHIIVLQEAFTERAKQIGLQSGYAFHADGPVRDDPTPVSQSVAAKIYLKSASLLKGETEGKWVDSGLQISSDYPIISVKRTAFPQDACAGYDCLATKGILLVEVRVPGQATPVTIVTTHLNSRHASGVSGERSIKAFRRQVETLDAFITSNHNPENPLIVSGDFNASSPARRRILANAKWALTATGNQIPSRSGLDDIRASTNLTGKLGDEAAYIAQRGRDWQFFGGGSKWSLLPVALQIPFGTEKDGSSLSDHLGFVIDYKIVAAPQES